MKSFSFLADKLEEMANKIDERVEKKLIKTADQICEDVKSYAPGNGTYRESIKVYPIEKTNDGMKVFIGSNMIVGPTKWTGGRTYNLGYLLEHGTFEHAIPNAFGWGFYYGFTDRNGRFHKGTLDKDWHPGSIAIPHYSLALEKNKKLIKDSIKETWRQL